MTWRTMLAAAALALVASPAARAQQPFRTITAVRQLHGERALTVHVDYAAGQFRLLPGGAGDLYRMEMRYDTTKFTPVRSYDPATGVLRLGLKTLPGQSTWHAGRRHEPVSSLDIALTPSVPTDLKVNIGAAKADVELGGLALRTVTYQTGASESEVRFSRPNPIGCDSLAFRAGAAEFDALELGNSGCREMIFDGGLGAVTLDFTGEWRRSADATVHVAVGTVKLRLPRDLGVAITVDRFLASFDQSGFTKRGGVYYTSNYSTSAHRLNLTVQSALGGIEVEWVGDSR